MILGPALIMLNKYILDDLAFPYPLFLSGLGVLFSALVAYLAIIFRYVEIQRKDQVEGMQVSYDTVISIFIFSILIATCIN
jgi:hypothetical protein